jgi:hypothetical protein
VEVVWCVGEGEWRHADVVDGEGAVGERMRGGLRGGRRWFRALPRAALGNCKLAATATDGAAFFQAAISPALP